VFRRPRRLRRAGVGVLAAGALVGLGGIASMRAPQAADHPLGPPPPGLDWHLPVPDDTPHTPAAIALGRALFFERQLSADGTISCASCHVPTRAFADEVPRSRGVRERETRRNTPSLLNAGYRRSFFWDGRVTSLEAQVLRPIVATDEMALSLDEAVRRLTAADEYRTAFAGAFGGPPDTRRLGQALAAFVRTLRAGDSRFDEEVETGGVLTDEERAGLALFRGRGNCAHCHLGPLLADGRFHNTGVSWGSADLGRYEVTGIDADRGKFRTPSLRDVARTAPYMHDGSMSTLEAVLDFYDRGGTPNPHLDPEIRPIRLRADERRQLLAFLRSLDSRALPDIP
jgi:cytochrome c peroxidase